MTYRLDEETVALLRDVVFWGNRLARHLQGVDERRFLADELISDACCWCLVCIGEAAGRIRQLRPDFRTAIQILSSPRHIRCEIAWLMDMMHWTLVSYGKRQQFPFRSS